MWKKMLNALRRAWETELKPWLLKLWNEQIKPALPKLAERVTRTLLESSPTPC